MHRTTAVVFVRAVPVILVPFFVGLTGCKQSRHQAEVTIYCSVDEQFADKVLTVYAERNNVTVRRLFDSEATKTTGLVNRIKAERGTPQADVFWSSEIFNTILLARAGLLQRYVSPAADDIPDRYKDPRGQWTATGLRARVLAYNTEKLKRSEVPTSWRALADPKWSKQVAMANPIAGTTRGHIAAMFVLWGVKDATAFLAALADNEVRIADGNSAAVRMVVRGDVLLCATDTDDVWVAQRNGAPVDLVYPDMTPADGETNGETDGATGGTLLIPCTAALLAGAKQPEQGRKLIDFLVSAEVERLLAESDSRNVPVRAAVRDSLGMTLPAHVSVDYASVAGAMDGAIESVREILLR